MARIVSLHVRWDRLPMNGRNDVMILTQHNLDEARLIKARCIRAIGASVHCVALSMTWGGHEILDQMRQDTVWNKIKRTEREEGLGLFMNVVVSIAKTVIGSMLP
jgi:hypothetical protein